MLTPRTAFPDEELADRRSRVRDAMSQKGLDVLIVSDPANIYYLSGYDGWSFYVPQALIMLTGESAPHWIGRPMDANGARLTTDLDDAHIHTYTEGLVQAPDRHPMDEVARLVESLGQARNSIGVEMDAYYFTAAAFARLQSNLPSARFLDADLLVNWCRAVKSPLEMNLIRDAARIASGAMRAAREAIAPGVRECDAAAAIAAAQYSGVGEVAGDYPAIVPLLPSQERTSAAHLTWTDRRYEKGDVVNVELAGCVRRYHAPQARTFCLGRPSRQHAELADVVTEGMAAAIGAVRAGASCADVELAWRAVLSRRGFAKPSRLGYSVGIGYPPDWGERTASLRSGDETELRTGMTFHLIAGMWLEDYGLEISETIAVTDSGCDVLTAFPRSLITLEP